MKQIALEQHPEKFVPGWLMTIFVNTGATEQARDATTDAPLWEVEPVAATKDTPGVAGVPLLRPIFSTIEFGPPTPVAKWTPKTWAEQCVREAQLLIDQANAQAAQLTSNKMAVNGLSL